MHSTEISVTLGVYTDPDYHYEVNVSDGDLNIVYKEGESHTHTMAFGSRDEMRAVAHAMLKALNVDLKAIPTDN